MRDAFFVWNHTLDPDELHNGFNKKNHYYQVYEYGGFVDKGSWEYDKKNKILTLKSDMGNDLNIMAMEVLELTKTDLIFKVEPDEDDNGYIEVHTFYFEHE